MQSKYGIERDVKRYRKKERERMREGESQTK